MNDREAQIRELLPLVRRIAKRIHRMVPTMDLDDLIGEGCVGLIRAVDAFDASRGLRIEKYAARIIAGSVLNGMRRIDPVSERVRREVRMAERERYALAVLEGAMPSQARLEAGRPGLQRAKMHAYRYAPLSLDSALPLGERLRADWSGDPARIAGERDERATIRAALVALPVRQQRVLELHYFAGQTLHQIGMRMCISPQRASQLHVAGLRNLRKVMHAAH